MRQPSQMLFLFLITIPFVTLITMGTASADMDTEDEFDLWMGTDEEISEAPGYEDPKIKTVIGLSALGLLVGLLLTMRVQMIMGLGMGLTWPLPGEILFFIRARPWGLT